MRVDDGPAVGSGVREPHQPASPIAASATWGSVDSQSIARWGSSIARPRRRGPRSRRRLRACGLRAPRVGDRPQAGAPDGAEVGHVLPLVGDRLRGAARASKPARARSTRSAIVGGMPASVPSGDPGAGRNPAPSPGGVRLVGEGWRHAGSEFVASCAAAAATCFEARSCRASRFSRSSARRPCCPMGRVGDQRLAADLPRGVALSGALQPRRRSRGPRGTGWAGLRPGSGSGVHRRKRCRAVASRGMGASSGVRPGIESRMVSARTIPSAQSPRWRRPRCGTRPPRPRAGSHRAPPAPRSRQAAPPPGARRGASRSARGPSATTRARCRPARCDEPVDAQVHALAQRQTRNRRPGRDRGRSPRGARARARGPSRSPAGSTGHRPSARVGQRTIRTSRTSSGLTLASTSSAAR